MFLSVVLLLVGLVILYFGADWLVSGASRLAFVLGISPLIVGLTVVAFGTSMPELVVSFAASWRGSPAVSLGNVVGSNICNIGLVLGLAALIRPVHVDQGTLRRDFPVMLVSSVAAVALAWLGFGLGHLDGAVLVAGMAAYTWFTIRLARRMMRPRVVASGTADAVVEADAPAIEGELEELEKGPSGIWPNVGLVVVGLACLVVGAELMVGNAIAIATALGVSEFVIAVSVVAVGTSLPELATSVVAAVKGESDISVGNIIGSNIFNVMWILGLVALAFGVPVDGRVLTFDLPIMLGVTLVLYPLMRVGFVVSRGRGALLLGSYAVYVAALVLVR